jgi:hypothetical protein
MPPLVPPTSASASSTGARASASKSESTSRTEVLEQQTATSEILRVISNSPTNIQPAVRAIAHSAVRLCGAA